MHHVHVVLVPVLLLTSLMITVINGVSAKHGVIVTNRSGRELTIEAVKGLLAWRKLLWDSKPAIKPPKHGFKRYYKDGGFEKALDDFLSAVPADKNLKQRGDIHDGRIYEGTVGDRKVVLRERGMYSANRPTIEISNGESKDKIIYVETALDKLQ